jgi:hypothetical protein
MTGPSNDIPQADSIPMIRATLAALKDGPTPLQVAQAIGITPRHVRYCLDSARFLGWVRYESPQLSLAGVETTEPARGTTFALTASGQALLATAPNSRAERELLGKALLASTVIGRICGDLLTASYSADALADRILQNSNLAVSTARRRAQTLLAWRRHALSLDNIDSQPEALHGPHGVEPDTSATPSQSSPRDPASSSQEHGRSGRGIELDSGLLAHIWTQLEQARLCLLTAPGFSSNVASLSGTGIPTDAELTRELWRLQFPDSPFEDDAQLTELLAVLIRAGAARAAEYLKSRFTAADASIPEWQYSWYSLPWSRVYTLTVDDTLDALQRRRSLTRPLTRESSSTHSAKSLSVHNLRGTVSNGTAFSADPQAWSQFDVDVLAYPFLFAGLSDDEDLLWNEIQRRGQRAPRGSRELRPRSYLILPTLSRVRRALLADHNIYWIRARPDDFAQHILAMPETTSSSAAGHSRLAARAATYQAAIHDVATHVQRIQSGRTEFLMGEEPTWADIQSGRAINREVDASLEAAAHSLLKSRTEAAPLLVVTGTAGSGKTTSLMRLAMALSAHGETVCWVDSDTSAPASRLREHVRSARPAVLAIDDLQQYGSIAAQLLGELSQHPDLRLIIAGARAVRFSAMEEDLTHNGLTWKAVSMPPLADSDIDLLLEALARDHRLGRLKGLTTARQQQLLREKSGRILLVAMIEATLDRRFEDKILDEYRELHDRAQRFYSLITLASVHRYPLPRETLLLATEPTRTTGDLDALDLLARAHIVAHIEDRGYRARHHLIAEKLFAELILAPSRIPSLAIDLAYAVTHGLEPDPVQRRETARWRFVKKFLNNRTLFEFLTVIEARKVYEAVEENLHWDYHFWLQRGALEVAEGNLHLAEQFLSQARALDNSDDFLMTEWAYLQMKRANAHPLAPNAEELLNEGVALLRGQIATRGRRDWKPLHVLISQSLNWARQERWTRDQRVAFLRGVHRNLKEGLVLHPRVRELSELDTVVTGRLLALQTIQ